MSERKTIERELLRKQREVAGLESKLQNAKVYVTALQKVLKLLDDANEEIDQTDAKLRDGSAVAQARLIILDKDCPVHIDDLLISMGKEVTRDAKASLASSLAAYVRRSEIFSRPAPNTFGLIELGHDTDDFDPQDEPVGGFGREAVAPASAFGDSSFADFDDPDDVPF